MGNQLDWIGQEHQPAFRDIRNQRDAVAEQKARLCLQLGSLINKVPYSIANGSVHDVREWRKARDAAAKIAKSSRSIVSELTAAINKMGSTD